ncbi:MAG: hypothetical protein AB8B52_14205 [Winogradskyella sp.]|uniref:hypothetical protein n=1 Tax=Winogradskyella sp. TaxID=1883156 RepID=UPI00385AA300
MKNRTIILLTILEFVATFLILNGFFNYEYLIGTALVAAVTAFFTLLVMLKMRSWDEPQEENFK